MDSFPNGPSLGVCSGSLVLAALSEFVSFPIIRHYSPTATDASDLIGLCLYGAWKLVSPSGISRVAQPSAARRCRR